MIIEDTIIDAVFGEFTSRIFNDVVDISKDKIVNAVKNKDKEHQNLESQLYNLIVDALNEIIPNQYKKDQDKIFDVAETLLIGFRNNEVDAAKTIKSCLCQYGLYNNDNHIEFKNLLYHRLSKEEYKELNNEIDLLWKEQQSKTTSRIEQKIDRTNQKLEKLDDTKDVMIYESDNKFQNNKKQKYIDNWNSRLFLHRNNNKNPLTLADTFIMPDFDYHVEISEINLFSTEKLADVIEKLFLYNGSLNLLIKGVPGMGKTSITSWIANEYENDNRIIILRFRDWEKGELENGLLKAIYNTLGCMKTDLNNRILILDGFDEIKSLNSTEQLLYGFFNEILDIDNMKVIIRYEAV